MATITAEQALAFSNKANEPYVQEFKKTNTLSEIYRDIEKVAKEGFLGLEYGLGHHIHHSVLTFIDKTISEQGFAVEFKHDKTFVKVSISWK
ncbi:MAG TPA: hypothetical protein VLB84_13840 [Bacteroidia bacterium]|nr:hypothetical protein [Bacteroidia bacterium]